MDKLSLIAVIKILMKKDFTIVEIMVFTGITEQEVYDLLHIPKEFRKVKNLKNALRLSRVKKLVQEHPILIELAKNYSLKELNKNISIYKNFEEEFKDFQSTI